MKDKEIVLYIYIFECEKYYSSIKKENPATSNKMDDLEGINPFGDIFLNLNVKLIDDR